MASTDSAFKSGTLGIDIELISNAYKNSKGELEEIVKYVSKVCKVPTVFITFINQGKLIVEASVGSDVSEMPLSQAFCGRVEALKEQVIIEDLLLDPLFEGHPLVKGKPGFRFYMGHPLVLPDGSMVGTISMLDVIPGSADTLKRQTIQLMSLQIERLLTLTIQSLELELKTQEIDKITAELALDESLLEGYSQSASDLVFILSPDHKIMCFNQVAGQVFPKYAANDIHAGADFLQVVPQALHPRYFNGFSKALLGEQIYDEFEYSINNETTYWKAQYRPFKGKSGEIIGVIINAYEISHHKSAENASLDQKDMLALYFNNTQDAICLLDTETRIIGYNKRFKDGMRAIYSAQIAVGVKLIEYLPEEQQTNTYHLLKQALDQGKFIMESHLPGFEFPEWWQITFEPLQGRSNSLVGVSMICKDVTELKKAEKQLKQHTERWKFAIEGSNDGIWIWNVKTNEVHLSDRYKGILGYAQGEVPDDFSVWADNVHPDDFDWVNNTLSDYLEGKLDRYEVEYRMRHKVGTYKYILDRGRIVETDEDGKPLLMAGTHTDITDRKETEQYLQLVRFSLENAIDPVVWIKEDASYVDCNQAALRHFGISRSELMGKKVFDFDPHYDQSKWPLHWQELKEKKHILLNTYHITPDGIGKHIEVHANYIEYAGQAYNCAFFKDISEQVEAQNTINSQYYTLKGINESTQNPIFSIDKEYRYTSFNQAHAMAMEALYGVKIEIGKVAIDYIPNPDFKAMLTADLTMSMMGEHLEDEKLYGEGEFARYFNVIHNPIKDNEGNVVGVAFHAIDITEKKRTEILLKESENRLKNIVENIPGAVFRYVLHPDGTDEIIYASSGCFNLWEISESRLASEGTAAVWSLIHPDDVQMMVDSVKVSANELSLWYCECRFIMTDGRIKYIKAYGRPFAAENNKVIWDTLQLDETDKHAAEEQLQWNLNLLNLMSSSSPMGFLVVNEKSDEIMYFNSRFCQLWNIEKYEDELRSGAYTNTALSRLVQNDLVDTEAFEKPCLNKLQENEVHEDELELKNGTFLRRFQSILRDNQGETVGLFYMFEDITERKKSEQTRRENEQLLNEIFNTSPIALMLSTLEDGKIERANKALADMVGIKEQDLLGRFTVDFYKDPNDRFPIINAIREKGFVSAYDLIILDAEGNDINCIVSLKILKVNNVDMIFTGFVDIGKRKQAEEQLKKSFELVNEQNKRLLNFSYIVSHNLRSHTGNIKSLIEIIDQSQEAVEKQFMFDLLKNASNTLSETIQNLTEVVSIQTSLNLKKEKIFIYEYTLKAVQILGNQISIEDAVITNEIDPNLSIEYYPAYMESILLNFLSNALKYRHPKRKPKISLKIHLEDGNIVLEITDNGIGIDLKKYGDKLFGMYKTFHGNKDARGIGLFMTKNQIEAMGGRVSVNSQPDKGSTFTIYFNS
jgi:PAS domain S-box-containing protein